MHLQLRLRRDFRAKRMVWPSLLGSAAAILFPCQAIASDVLADVDDAPSQIVVTAQRRSENIQTVPISVKAFSDRELRELHVERPSDLAAATPGLAVAGSRGDQNPVFSVRGIGLNDIFSNNNPSVGFYLDEVVLPYTPMLSLQLFDLERIEVLKGPQGTLYGRNTTGGAINILSAKPAQRFDAYVSGTLARFGRKELEGAIGGGLTDTLAIRLSGKTVQQTSGWQYNTLTGRHLGKIDDVSLRGQALWTPSDRLTVHITGNYIRDRSEPQMPQHMGYYAAAGGTGGFCAPALAGKRDENACVDFLGYRNLDPNPRNVATSSIYGTRAHSRGYGAYLSVDQELGFAKLTSVTGYNRFRRTSPNDDDASPLVQLDTLYRDDIRSFTQELRLTSHPSAGPRWVAGLYHSRDRIAGAQDGATNDLLLTRVRTSFDQTSHSTAAFAQIDYPVASRLVLTTGLRVTRDDKKYAYDSVDLNPFSTSLAPPLAGSVRDRLTQTNISGKASLAYRFDRDAMAYASYSRGYKAGGFKAALAFSPAELAPFRGETIDAYEAGVKTSWLDGRLTLNAALYWNEWHNFQASVTIIENGVSVFTLANAGDARSRGAELETSVRPTSALTLHAALNWLDSRVTRFNTANNAADYTGNRLANAPTWSAATMIRWRTPVHARTWDLFAAADMSYKSKTDFTLSNRAQNAQSAYTLLNGQISIESKDGKWEAAIFGRNILNKLYRTFSFDNFGGVFPSSNFLGDPATYGIRLARRY